MGDTALRLCCCCHALLLCKYCAVKLYGARVIYSLGLYGRRRWGEKYDKIIDKKLKTPYKSLIVYVAGYHYGHLCCINYGVSIFCHLQKWQFNWSLPGLYKDKKLKIIRYFFKCITLRSRYYSLKLWNFDL